MCFYWVGKKLSCFFVLVSFSIFVTETESQASLKLYVSPFNSSFVSCFFHVFYLASEVLSPYTMCVYSFGELFVYLEA